MSQPCPVCKATLDRLIAGLEVLGREREARDVATNMPLTMPCLSPQERANDLVHWGLHQAHMAMEAQGLEHVAQTYGEAAAMELPKEVRAMLARARRTHSWLRMTPFGSVAWCISMQLYWYEREEWEEVGVYAADLAVHLDRSVIASLIMHVIPYSP